MAARTLQDELLELLARQARTVPVPVFLVAAAIAGMAYQHPETGYWPLAWLALVAAVLAARWFVLGRLPGLASVPISARLNIAVAMSALNGITHGLSLVFFDDLDEDFERAIQSMLLIGLCAGSVGTTAGHTRVFLAFILPTLGPLAIVWALSESASSTTWLESAAALLFVFLGLVLFRLAQEQYRMFTESFNIRLEQAKLNEQLNDALARLRAALDKEAAASRAKTRFLASASHDLRQPIHNLGLFTAVLSMRPLDERGRKAVKELQGELTVLSSELHALLDMSKLDAGLVRAEKQMVEIRPVAEHLQRAFAADAQKKGLEFVVDCPEDLHAHTDPGLIERVLRNLLENAIKYTPAGTVTLKALGAGERVVVSVADTGPGIPEDKHEQIFEEFYQIENPERDRAQGLGLGLSIVKRHAELLGIPLELVSAPGKGTTFVLTLERVRPASPVAAVGGAQVDVPLRGLHVLVVDDEAKVRLAMKALLEDLGCRVSDAEGTADAARLARADRPDVVLADFRLRGRDDGLGTVRALRDIYPDVPALIVSGDTAPERLREAHDAGMRLLHKPVDPEVLKRAIAVSAGRLSEESAATVT